MPDGQVVFEITGDKRQISKSLSETTQDIERESKKWDASVDSSTRGMGNSFTSMLTKISGALAAAKIGERLLAFGSEAIEFASSLQEVQNVVDVTFGDGANQIESWAKKAQSQFGLTEIQAKQFTSTLGAMMKSAGLAGPEIVGMSTDLAGLAADMASFYNMDFETAFQKIRSGISGETEPLKQLGINMSVANLEAYAMTQGITKAFDKMSQSEQTMIRYQYLMQATADAQGDFARTADGYANSQRRIETAISSIKTSAGTLLMGFVEPLTSGLADVLTQLTKVPERTVLDDFAEIDTKASEKIAEIENTARKANDLISVLQSIEQTQLTNTSVTSWLEGLNTKLGGLDTAITAAKSGNYAGTLSGIAGAMELKTGVSSTKWRTLLGAISEKLPAAAQAVGEGGDMTSAFLTAAGEAAEELGGEYPGLWKTFMETLGSEDTNKALAYMANGQAAADAMRAIGLDSKGLDGSEKDKWAGLLGVLTTADPTKGLFGNDSKTAATNIESLATGLTSKDPATRQQAWSDMLGVLSNNIPAVARLAKQSPEDTKKWLEGLADSASKIDPNDPDAWNNLFNTLVTGLPGLAETELGQAFLNNLKTLANDSNMLNSGSGRNWERLLTALNNADVTSGIFGTDAAGKITAMSDALSSSDPTKKKEAWEQMLGVLTSNADKISELTGKSTEELSAWFADLNSRVPEAGDDLNAWNELFTELVNGIGGLDGVNFDENFLTGFSTVAEDANKLTTTSTQNWSRFLTKLSQAESISGIFGDAAATADGINKLSSALTSNDVSARADGWQTLLSALSDNAEGLSALTGESVEETKKWLEGLATAANSLDAGDTEGWNQLFTVLQEGLPGLKDDTAGMAFFAQLSAGFMGLENSSSQAEDALKALGIDTDNVADKQALWLATCRKLVATIPGLSEIINTETGEIKGGIPAIQQYVTEYENANKKIIAMQALRQKEEALAAKRVQMADYELEYKAADEALKAFEAEHKELAKTLKEKGLLGVKDSNDPARKQYMELLTATKAANDNYIAQAEALAEAEEKMRFYKKAVEDMPGDVDKFAESTEEATEATGQFTASQKDAEAAIKGATSALQEVDKYYNNTADGIRKTLQGLAGMFEAIETPAQKAAKQMADLDGEIKKAENDTQKLSLTAKKEGLGEDIASMNKMLAGLTQRATFYQKYAEMLEQARAKGVSEDILSSLADGSTQSYDYLTAILDGTVTKDDIESLNAKYKEVKDREEELTGALTDQQLKTDEAFQGLVDAATDAINNLNLGEQAQSAMEQTVQGIANGISSKIPEVQTQVDALNAVLNQLHGTGKFSFSKGRFVFGMGSGGLLDGELSIGMDYVPFDNYLAALHEGESVLTAEEAKVWRDFKYNGAASRNTVDYDALGATMRDNVKAGGNVYLDGQTVGRVISARQADSYRAMERSGFQQ